MYTTLLGLQRSNLSCFLKVRRDNLIYTALSEIMTKQEDLKKPLRVVFVGEEGVDDGGVRTEFFSLVLKQIFDVNFGMFEYSEQTRLFWFNPFSLESQNEFKLIGTMIGLAIYNGIILDIKLPLVVYKKLLGMEPTFDDLESLDPELHRGLQQLLDFEGDVEDVYCRTFEVESEAFGSISKYELIPNGANIAVTCENRKQVRVIAYALHVRVISLTFKHFSLDESSMLTCSHSGSSLAASTANLKHLQKGSEWYATERYLDYLGLKS